MANEGMGKLIPFSRSAEEVRALALRHLDQGSPLRALELLRVSLSKAPDDPDTLLASAEAYASMDCWQLSNDIYARFLDDEAHAGAAFFAMGENFLFAQMPAIAHDCFVLSVQKGPEGAFVSDAIERLDMLEEIRQEPDPLDQRLQRRMDRVLGAMDREKARLATRLIRRVLPLDRRSSGIRAMQAFSRLAAKDAKGSLASARMAYRLDPEDIRALCAMASALQANHSQKAARRFLARAADLIEQHDDAQLVCQTACEMGEHGFVRDLLGRVQQRAPYAADLLHTLAAALYNTGARQDALRLWRLLRRIDPCDAAAEYRLNMAEKALLPDRIPYAPQVPLSEILDRLERLKQWVHEGPERMRQRFAGDETLECMVRWGLYSGERGIPQAMCGILSTLDVRDAERMLRGLLIDPSVASAIKQTALTALFTAGAEGPFYAVMDDRMTMVHVSKADGGAKEHRSRQGNTLWEQASKWLKAYAVSEDAMLERLCVAAASFDGIPESQRMRAVVVAYCRHFGVPVPFSSTYAGRRKVERVAGRLLRSLHADKGEDYAADQL